VIWLLLPLICSVPQPERRPVDLGLSIGPGGQLLVCVQPLADWLGATTQWSPADRRVSISRDQRAMNIWVDRGTAEANGAAVPLTDRPRMVDGHVVAPLRPIVEAFGGTVELRVSEMVVVLRDRGAELRARVPQGPPAYHAGYPPDLRRRGAWVCLQQFMYALRDGRTADAETHCTAEFIADYGGRFLRPRRPYRLEVFELEGWQDTPDNDVYVRVCMYTRDVTSRTTQRYDFRLTAAHGDWRLASAVRR
jgi:hypothetical protein